MSEQTNNEKNKKSKKSEKNEKKFYLFTAIGCAVVLVAIIVIAVIVSNTGSVQGKVDSSQNSASDSVSDTSVNGSVEDSSSDEPAGTIPEGMVMPVALVSVGNDYGFYHNTTLNTYYEHTGVDFMAEVGAEVYAVDDGVVESIYKDDILLGTEITVAHENGVKSVYRFVTEKEGLTVGAKVSKGEVIATIAQPSGNEYKDGAHLHFEIIENGKQIDPTTYLTLEEK